MNNSNGTARGDAGHRGGRSAYARSIPSAVDQDLPGTIASALITASQEIEDREEWVPPRRGIATRILPRLVGAVYAIDERIGVGPRVRQAVREKTIQVMAYLPADLRLSALVDMVNHDSDIVDDLFLGSISPECEKYRYNLLTTLGVFARHSLVEEVFTRDRVKAVGRSMKRSRAAQD